MKKEELLHKYFLGELSQKEMDNFNELLSEDEGFKEQFEFEKSIKRVIKSKKRDLLNEKVAKLEQRILTADRNGKTNNTKNVKSAFNNTTVWRIAASVAALLSLGIYIFNTNPNVEKLYSDHYSKYPNTVYPITMGNENDNSLEIKAFQAYESDDYKKAIPLFISLKEKKNYEYADFYLGLSYLNTDHTENAISSFKGSISFNHKFSKESKWYLALAYLKNNDKPSAIKQLKEIVKDMSYKHQEAKILLEDIN